MKENRSSGLSESELDELSSLLASKRRQLEERGRDLETQLTTRDDCSLTDAADVAGRQEGRHRAHGLLEQLRSQVREIDAALLRIERGRYGIDEETGEPIGYARLALVPWARTRGG